MRAPLGPRLALDGGAAAYIFPGGTNLGANAALGYFIPVGRQWSLPVKVRGDVVNYIPHQRAANIARDAGLPRGANAITRELKDLWLTGEDE